MTENDFAVEDLIKEQQVQIASTRVTDACGAPLTYKLMEQSFANAWYGRHHPESIRAERRTLQYALYKTQPGVVPGYPQKFLGAVFVDDATVPAGEIHFNVESRPELSTKIINLKVEDVPWTSVHRVAGRPEVLDTHTSNVSQDCWNELWNSLSPEDRFMDDSPNGDAAIFLLSPFGRKLRITCLPPAKETK